MAVINDRINVNAILQTVVSPEVTLSVGLLLIDDDRIPISSRYISVTPSDFGEELPAGVMEDFASVYFGQDVIPPELRFGRWISAASSPMFECGPAWDQTYAAWAAIADAVFDVTDGTNTDQVGPFSLVGVTAIDQIIPILIAALVAVGAPTVSGLNTSVFEFSPVDGVLRLNMSTSGSAAATVSIIVGTAVGTDISALLMDAPNGTSISGFDAETPEDALAAISVINDEYYWVMVDSATDDEHADLAAYIEPRRKLGIYVTDTADAINEVVATDLGPILKALAYQRAVAGYTEKKGTEYLDAAAIGGNIAATPGTRAYSWNRLRSITDSGDPNPLSKGVRNILENKGYNWSEQYKESISIFYPGLTSFPIEIRIMHARDYFMLNLENDFFNIQLANELSAFDDPTFAQLESAITDRCQEQVDNRTGTEFTIDMPDPDDISDTVRGTHRFTAGPEVFVLKLNSKINEIYITGIWEG